MKENVNLQATTAIIKYLGYALLITAVVVMFMLISSDDEGYTYAIAAVSAFITGIVLIAFSELIGVIVKIEINTRKDSMNYKDSHDYFENIDVNKNKESFDQWKKANPGKTRNDYYASTRR